jgi:LysM repeat protein
MAFDVLFTNGVDAAQGWLTNDPVTPSQGYGGHPLASRPKRKGLTVWQGRQPFAVDFPLLLFRGGRGHTVEKDREALERMATIESVEDYTYRHGVFVVPRSGLSLPIPTSVVTEWWVEDLTWGEEIREPPEEGGFLTRKLVNVKLLERVDDQVLGSPKGGAGTRQLTFPYKVRKGDTLAKIAAAHSTTVAEIKKLNPSIRSDGKLIANKTVLNLPAPFAIIREETQPTSRG